MKEPVQDALEVEHSQERSGACRGLRADQPGVSRPVWPAGALQLGESR